MPFSYMLERKKLMNSRKAYPGVIRYRTYGDKELEDILQEIEKRTNISHYDLNNDNAVDLVDLQLFSTSYTANPKENILSTIETSIPSSIVKPEHADNVEVKSGSLDQLFSEETQESVQLATKEPISVEKPLEVSFTLGKDDRTVPLVGVTIQPGGSENQISGGSILVETQDGVEEEYTIISAKDRAVFVKVTAKTAILNDDGSISVDFGGQIAVKKVTIKVTSTTAQSGNLVEISKVEFVNDMESKIPEPELNIPSDLQAKAGNKEFTLNWSKRK